MEDFVDTHRAAPAAGRRMPSHLPLGAELLALVLSEEASRVAGLAISFAARAPAVCRNVGDGGALPPSR